jgi:hypothetical protein
MPTACEYSGGRPNKELLKLLAKRQTYKKYTVKSINCGLGGWKKLARVSN